MRYRGSRLDERKEGFRLGDKTERYIESESNRRSRGIGGVVDGIGELWRVAATLTLSKSTRYNPKGNGERREKRGEEEEEEEKRGSDECGKP